MEAPIASPASSSATDVRPILRRNSENIWAKAESERDKLYGDLARAALAEGIEPLLLKSPPFVYPPWVKVESWMPQGDQSHTDRIWATITVQPKPCHRYEFEYDLSYLYNGKQKKRPRLVPFGEQEIRALLRYLLRRGQKPYLEKFRDPGSFAIWRPHNKIDSIRTDLYATLGSIMAVVGIILLFSESSLLGFMIMLLGGGVLWLATWRPLCVLNDGKPSGEPRELIRVDSWQTVIFGIGDQAALFRARFLKRLEEPITERFRWHIETVWYWGLDGKEEREQVVLVFGRGTVFCQIYQYGKDLYIGWDGHLNAGQWVEKTVAKGIEKSTGKLTSVQTVTPGTQVVSEYDIIDLNCLMEWAHAQMVKIAREFLEEFKIDQEIDFKIIRGGRQGLTKDNKEKESVKERLKLGFARTG